MKNLKRVQGFLDELDQEIDDPQKTGPGTSRQEWRELTHALQGKLIELDEFLSSKQWKSVDE